LLYRNFDKEFEDTLSKPSAERKISVDLEFKDYKEGFILEITDETAASVAIVRPFKKELAGNPQGENIRTQLVKLGNTPFEAAKIMISLSNDYFVPSSVLNEMRREVADKLLRLKNIRYKKEILKRKIFENTIPYPVRNLDYTANVYNVEARKFYEQHGASVKEPAFEKQPVENVPLMFTKHCLKYSLGWCPVLQKNKPPHQEPFCLKYKENRLKLTFDCKQCIMMMEKIR
jgi:putative protease